MSKIHKYTEDFMRTAGQVVRDTPSIPTREEMELRLSLEFEELYEKAQAMGLERTFIMKVIVKKLSANVDGATKSFEWRRELKKRLRSIESAMPVDTQLVNLVEVFDAALDQNVVWSGTNLAFGLRSVIDEGDLEVYRSNMSKFDTNTKSANLTKEKYEQEGIVVIQEQVGDLIVTKRANDLKILKSYKYSATKLAPILRKVMKDRLLNLERALFPNS
jgi:hypothetical protein